MEVHALNLGNELHLPVNEELLSLVSEQRQAVIKRYFNNADAQRSMYAELLLRVILRKIGIHSEEIQFGANPNGKPYLQQQPDFHFNLSHSGEWVVCAIDTNPVGIDVEIIHPVDYSMAERCFSSKEIHLLFNKPEPEKLSYFFDLWTLKESYVKAVGKGLSMPFHSFSILVEDGKIVLESPQSHGAAYAFSQFDIDSGYKLAVCGSLVSSVDNVVIWELEAIGPNGYCTSSTKQTK